MLIETPRLVLRDFDESDWPAVVAYHSDPRYLRFYPWTTRAPADARAFVAMFIGWQRETPRHRFQLAITLRDGGRLIGNCGIRQPEADAREAELGYELDPAHWRQGYATEAATAMLRFAFVDLGLHRVSATCIADNAASVRVLERLGLRQEGRLLESEWFKERWWDVLLYASLDREWRAREGDRKDADCSGFPE